MAGLLERLGLSKPKPLPIERRDVGSIGGIGWGVGSYNGTLIDAARAENLSTVLGCVGAISSAIAALPANVYRQTEAGRELAPDHPVARLLRCPNDYQTWPDFIETVMSSVLMFGNSVCVMLLDGAGRPTSILPIPWSSVLCSILPSGEVIYDILSGWPNSLVAPGRYPASQVLHLKDRSDNLVVGRSRLSRCPELLSGCMALAEFAANTFLQSAAPIGFIKHPGILSREAKDYLSLQYAKSHAGPNNARSTPILDEGMEWQSGSATPEDAELLASRHFSVEELCRVFGTPPPIVQDYSHNTFTNSAQASLWFASNTLLPWVTKIEMEFKRSVFADVHGDFHLVLDMTQMLRGDPVEQREQNRQDVAAGVMSINEARHSLGLNPIGPKP